MGELTDYENFIFVYNAKVVRVVDGDTVYCEVDLGFHVKIIESFRLSRVDTPEIWRPINEFELDHGRRAKQYLVDLIEGKEVIIETSKTGKYGRWVADIYYEGKDIQDLLIENGFEKLDSY